MTMNRTGNTRYPSFNNQKKGPKKKSPAENRSVWAQLLFLAVSPSHAARSYSQAGGCWRSETPIRSHEEFPPGSSRLFIPSLGCYMRCMRLPKQGCSRQARELPGGACRASARQDPIRKWGWQPRAG
jgi:hypothetical protein